MQLRPLFHRLLETKILQNYSYMSALNAFSALAGLIIYPYVIRIMGAEQYGLYAFVGAVVMYFQAFLDFGFEQPGAKAIVQCKGDITQQSRVISAVLFAKLLLLIAAIGLASLVALTVPVLRQNTLLFMIVFLQPISTLLFPIWYFQGIKDMRTVSIVQFLVRFSQIPLVFLFVRTQDDLILYAVVITVTIFARDLSGFAVMWHKGIRIVSVSWSMLRTTFADAIPFFLTSITVVIKERTMMTLIGAFCGMRDVAVYDLAMKIIQIPRIFTSAINTAIFPEVVDNAPIQRVRRILKYERYIATGIVLGIILLGYPAAWVLGGSDMVDAYPLVVVLSFTVYAFLIVGAYLQFVFVPHNRYRLVTYNQMVALFVCFLICGVGLPFVQHPMLFAVAWSVSGLAEIGFCRYVCRKNGWL